LARAHNLTLSYGLRYEAQTNIGDHAGFAPRAGRMGWIRAERAAKTVIHAGFGSFSTGSGSHALNALRFNGVTRQSFSDGPRIFPAVPAGSTLSRRACRRQLVDRTIRAAPGTARREPAGDQVFPHQRELSGRPRSICARTRYQYYRRPISVRHDPQLRYLTETTGFSRSHMLQLTPSVNYKRLMLFGFYALSYGMSDAEGQAADPYHLRAEWGLSSFGDVRHRLVIGGNLPLPLKFSAAPFVIVSSGAPYNLTTGRDSNGDSITAERPALVWRPRLGEVHGQTEVCGRFRML
jgi:hypothetical protein